jgi:NAD(P)-dependent dehydrogenase (short-subunit alcohol dehydrogenase family)
MDTAPQTAPPDLSALAAVITGGSRGIGRAIATALAARGARVAITGRNDDDLRAAAGATIHPVRADVSRPDQAVAAIDSAAEQFGGLDLLVNNAGVATFANAADMSVDAWQQIIGTNLSGAFYCSRAAIPHLRRRGGGWIINISSLAGRNPFVGGAAYCASKAGLDAFTEALMQEVRHDNIRVSGIAPGSVATGFAGRGDVPASAQDWKIAPDDIASLVLDLVTFPQRSLPSRIEIRPSRPPQKTKPA